MGTRVQFAGERKDDLAARMKQATPAYDATLVPPSLLREPRQLITGFSRIPLDRADPAEEVLARQRYEMDLEFLDHSVPALNGKTPRQAASDPALRPLLLRLMKPRIADCDLRNLETGRRDDINWMLRELDLHEILFDPPPPRPPLKLRYLHSGDEVDSEPEFLRLPPPPPLPEEPFDRTEALARFDKAMGAFSNMSKAIAYLEDLDYPLFSDVRELVGDLLDDREFAFLLPGLALLVLSFAPRGTRPPETIFDALADDFEEHIATFRSWTVDAKQNIADWVEESSQPALLSLAVATLESLAAEAPVKLRPREQPKLIYLIILRTVVDELDASQRELQGSMSG